MNISAELQAIVDRHALKHSVSNAVHESDFILQFLLNNPVFPSKEHAIQYYFSDGDNSARQFIGLVSQFLDKRASEAQILEFASGYGCVSRHLKNARGYTFTACDIHPEAINLIANKIGLNALLSATEPELFSPPQEFDVVFALSFFSHMPRATWGRWITSLLKAVRVGGLLIFTTHGRQSIKHFGEVTFDQNGYWFRADSEQKDLSTSDYGQTIVLPKYVINGLEKNSDASLIFFQEAYWWGHQDTYVLRKR